MVYTYCDDDDLDLEFKPASATVQRYFSNSQKLLLKRRHDYTPDGILRKKTRMMNLVKSSRRSTRQKNQSLQKLHEHLNTSVVERSDHEGSNFRKMR